MFEKRVEEVLLTDHVNIEGMIDTFEFVTDDTSVIARIFWDWLLQQKCPSSINKFAVWILTVLVPSDVGSWVPSSFTFQSKIISTFFDHRVEHHLTLDEKRSRPVVASFMFEFSSYRFLLPQIWKVRSETSCNSSFTYSAPSLNRFYWWSSKNCSAASLTFQILTLPLELLKQSVSTREVSFLQQTHRLFSDSKCARCNQHRCTPSKRIDLCRQIVRFGFEVCGGGIENGC